MLYLHIHLSNQIQYHYILLNSELRLQSLSVKFYLHSPKLEYVVHIFKYIEMNELYTLILPQWNIVYL